MMGTVRRIKYNLVTHLTLCWLLIFMLPESYNFQQFPPASMLLPQDQRPALLIRRKLFVANAFFPIL
jgi:hypothetical protein